MHALWHFILYVLACWSHDPATLNAERARCAGAVNVAYAAMAQEPPAPKRAEPVNPAPDATPAVPGRVAPKQPADHSADAGKMVPAVPRPTIQESRTVPPCVQCSGTGRIYRSDGGYVKCPCQCPTGKCPTRR